MNILHQKNKKLNNNLNANDVLIEMSLPNRAGFLTPIDGTDEDEQVTMIVMPVMMNS